VNVYMSFVLPCCFIVGISLVFGIETDRGDESAAFQRSTSFLREHAALMFLHSDVSLFGCVEGDCKICRRILLCSFT
jgi:hypothetical protein